MNKQTRDYHKSGISVLNQGQSPGFKKFEIGTQPSKRRTKWGLKLSQGSRDIIYMEEHKNRAVK